MAYDFIIYARRDRLPSAEQLAARLAEATPAIAVRGELPDPLRRGGLLPARIGGREVGIDVLYGTIEPDEAAQFEADVAADGEEMSGGNAQHLTILRTCDSVITLSGRSADEIEAAKTIATTLAAVSDGYLCDPQASVVIEPR